MWSRRYMRPVPARTRTLRCVVFLSVSCGLCLCGEPSGADGEDIVFARTPGGISQAQWTAGVAPAFQSSGQSEFIGVLRFNTSALRVQGTSRSRTTVFVGPLQALSHDTTIGYLCCLISCLGFGSSYIPVKQVDVKDGMLFTLCLSFGVLCVGAIQWLASGLYKFEPFAMLGGALWATGNFMVPFIIQNCGLGIGQLVWSVTNMLTGWASGTFGLFGKHKDVVAHPALNYVGVLIAILSLGIFKFMKSSTSEGDDCSNVEVRSARQFALGFVAALITGAFFGSNFNPPTYLQQLGEDDRNAGLPMSQWRHSPEAMDYVFSHFCGIFATSLIGFVIYCGASRGRVFLGKEVILPGIVSGAVWAIAQVAWFKANGVLSYVIAFPIIVGVPGLFAALWGVILFGENRGRHNLTVLAVIIFVQAVAVSIIAASKG